MKKQQGDVIIRSIKEMPAYAKRVAKQRRGFILAEGEATGHAHVIEEEVEMFEKNGILYLKVDSPVTVKHEEHKPISLDKGVYEIGRVREYDPFDEEVRKVAD